MHTCPVGRNDFSDKVSNPRKILYLSCWTKCFFCSICEPTEDFTPALLDGMIFLINFRTHECVYGGIDK